MNINTKHAYSISILYSLYVSVIVIYPIFCIMRVDVDPMLYIVCDGGPAMNQRYLHIGLTL